MADFEEMRNAYLRATQDDIVTRLRRLNNSLEGDDSDWICTSEAADEIERLRAERDHWQEQHRLCKECLDFIYSKKRWWQK